MKNPNIDYIYFDMDGTIANLYSVDGWLEKLRAFDPSPYADAAPMINFAAFARILNRLQKDGYKIGIITWGSKESNMNYDFQTELNKLVWLEKHLPSVKWDSFHFQSYGTEKSSAMKSKKAILFDDNIDVRNNWQGYAAFNEQNILEILKLL